MSELSEAKTMPEGLFYRAAEDEGEAAWGLRYILQQIEATSTYRPNIGQIHLAVSSLKIAIAALDAARAEGAQPSISTDGPHAITDIRHWLARQLLDSKLSDQSAFSIVAHAPSIKAARAEGPAPVSAPLDREGVARIIDPDGWATFDRQRRELTTMGRDPESERGPWMYVQRSLAKADAILAPGQQDQVGLTTPAVEGRGGPCPALPADGSDNGKREPPGPVNCNVVIRREAIKPYPRTCARCGLGPCPFYNKDRTVKP